MWQHNYEPVGEVSAYPHGRPRIPILVLFYMLGVKRKPAWMAAMTALAAHWSWRSSATACRSRWRSSRRCTGWRSASSRSPGSVRLDHAVSAGGRYRQVRDHQGLGRRPDQRSAPAGNVHRLLFGAFIEGAAGFGAPVGMSAAMLAGLDSRRSTPPASVCSPTRRQ